MSHISKAALALVLLASAIASSAVFAEEKKEKVAGAGPNPYSDCGIGAALFTETKWAAVSSNVIWDLGSTAVTSATLSADTCSGKQVKVALFIRDTQVQLAEEAATGSGEHLTAVLNLSECNASRHAQAIGAIRGTMAKSVGGSGYSSKNGIEKSTVLYQAVEAAVRSSCAI